MNLHRLLGNSKNLRLLNFTPKSYSTDKSIPQNIEAIENSSKSLIDRDRSREISSDQSNQLGSVFANISSSAKLQNMEPVESTEYDVNGNAHMEIPTNVPEPFRPMDDGGNLKEGIPEGMSDGAIDIGKRWSMEERLDFHNHQ